MFKNQSISNQYGRLNVWAFVMLNMCLFVQFGYGETTTDDRKQAIIQGTVHIHPIAPIHSNVKDKIQPGTSIKIVVTIENTGQQVSPVGQQFVRFAFDHPLEKEDSSIIFETEKKHLPAIEPGQKVEISFDTPHLIPSLLDFIRYDWPLREYQAIAVIDQRENIIGTLAITFSAYYYPGIEKQFPIKIANHSPPSPPSPSSPQSH
jgi:hypothetical protein